MAWVEKHGNRWRGKYRDADGRTRVAGSSTSKRAAKKLAEDKESEIRHGVWQNPDAGRMLFSEYFTKHFLPNKTVELNTKRTYQTHYDVSLEPEFGNVELMKITGPRIQRWVSKMEREGVGVRTIEGRFISLQTILAGRRGVSAMRDGLIVKNPCEGITLPARDARSPEVYTPPEVELLMTELGPQWSPVALLAAETGMRWGELMGLKVKDFNEDFTVVNVRRTLLQVAVKDTGNGTPYLEKPRPKGKQARRLTLDDAVAAMLKTYVRERRLFPEDRLFSMPDKDGLPLRTEAWPTGLPISRTWYRTRWVKAHKEAGVQPRRFHDLRGSHVSWLLAGGADIKTVMDRVGHNQLSTTQLYVGALDGSDERALDALRVLKARYSGPKPTPPQTEKEVQ